MILVLTGDRDAELSGHLADWYENENSMMNTRLFLFALLLTISCTQPGRLDRKIVGKWTMEKVFEYEEDVSEKHNPGGDRWIEFRADGTFESDGVPFGRNTGKWSADNEESILYVDSDADDDDSEWRVTFTGDQVFWTGIGHARKENTRIVHRRTFK